MSNIEFDGENASKFAAFQSRQILGAPQVPGMASWLMKKGIIKEEGSAKGVLIAITIVNFAIMAAVLYFFVFN